MPLEKGQVRYVKLNLSMGFVVGRVVPMLKFFCCKLEDERQLIFARELEQLGVETFHPRVLGVQQNWNPWIAENADNIDAFLINRPSAANTHMTACQQTGKPVLYFCHDLQTLRDSREAEIQGDLKRAAAIKAQEMHEIELFRAATAAYTPSSFEQSYLREKYGLQNVILHPVFMFDGKPEPRRAAPPVPTSSSSAACATCPISTASSGSCASVWPMVDARPSQGAHPHCRHRRTGRDHEPGQRQGDRPWWCR